MTHSEWKLPTKSMKQCNNYNNSENQHNLLMVDMQDAETYNK